FLEKHLHSLYGGAHLNSKRIGPVPNVIETLRQAPALNGLAVMLSVPDDSDLRLKVSQIAFDKGVTLLTHWSTQEVLTVPGRSHFVVVGNTSQIREFIEAIPAKEIVASILGCDEPEDLPKDFET